VRLGDLHEHHAAHEQVLEEHAAGHGVSSFDTRWVRAQFPALDDQVALFDNAGGSVPARSVIARVTDYMSRYGVQLGASYSRSVQAGALVDAGKAAAAAFVNAAPDEVILSGSSTQCVRNAARALREIIRPGDVIVVTDLDHECNIGAWREFAESGVEIREWQFDRDTQALTMMGLERVLDSKVKLVAFTHCSNFVGGIHDTKAFVKRIHEAGALSCVDGVAYAPHRRVDVRALDTDFYFLSLYKTFGPHQALLYGKREHWDRAKSLNHFFLGEDAGSYRFEPGNVNHELTAALPGILDHLLALDAHVRGAAQVDTDTQAALSRAYEAIAQQEASLVKPLTDFLLSHKSVRLMGPQTHEAAKRVATVGFTVQGRDSASIPALLDAQDIAIRYGHFYAHRAATALGLHANNGVVRVSMAHYNSHEEVARLVQALERALA
jgi:cysteine desulfurase family protein (TIGR01976 family)